MLVAWSLPVPVRDPAGVRAGARHILDAPEFRPPRRSIPAAAWHWLSVHVGRWLSHLLGFGRAATWGDALAAVVAAAALAVVAWALWQARGRPRRLRSRSGSGVVVSDLAARRRARTWLAEAEEAEGAGQWREAIRCRYGALLAELAETGLTELRPGRTSGEYRLDVSRRCPAVRGTLADVTLLFERCWYGDVHADQAACTRFASMVRAVMDAAAPAAVRVGVGVGA